jgi:hypothetical protein
MASLQNDQSCLKDGYLTHPFLEKKATAGSVDLRFLFPLLLSLLALRQIFTKSPGLKTSHWYVLAWYAFDSFMKLNNTKESPQPNDH